MNILRLLFISLSALFLACSESKFKSITVDMDKNGKPDQIMHTHSGLNTAVLIETDTDMDGRMEDYLWVSGEATDVKSSLLLFNLIMKNGKPKSKTWYGPGNVKLIEKSDEDEDGYLETTAYFNRFAKPKVMNGIVARIEIDSNKDQNGYLDLPWNAHRN